MKKLRITVNDKAYEVTVEVLSDDAPQRPPADASARPAESAPPHATAPPAAAQKVVAAAPPGGDAPGSVASPLAGVVISLLVSEGDEVEQGQELVILEAMKMENQVTSPIAGTVKSVFVAEGDSVPESHVMLVVE